MRLRSGPSGLPSDRPDAVRELASGVDALYLSGRAEPAQDVLSRLAAAQATAKAIDDSVEFDAGWDYLLLPYSWGKYSYCLTCEFGRVGIRAAGTVPEVRVQPKAEALHALSPRSVVEFFDESLSSLLGTIDWSVSRIDLYVDVQGWTIGAPMAERFVARTKQLATHHGGELCTGFQFGTRKSKSISARLYDKTVEMHSKNAEWVRDSWGDRYDPSQPVHRVEFEIRRTALTQFGVSTPDEVLEAVGDLWRYCTVDWLRLCTPTEDGTRSRWPTDPGWAAAVQGASLRQNELGLARVTARKRARELDRILPALVGYLVSFAVLRGCIGLTDTFHQLRECVRSYEARNGITFRARVRDRHRQARQ